MKTVTRLTRAFICGVMIACAAVPACADQPTAAAIEQTPQHLALADALVEAAQISSLQKAMVPQIVDLMTPLMVRGNETHADQIRSIVNEEMSLAFLEKLPEMLQVARDAYARHLSDQELRDITFFYRTPAGARLIRLSPLITSESMQAGAGIGRDAAQVAVPKIVNRMRKANLKVPDRP
jgi:hypothetical protein